MIRYTINKDLLPTINWSFGGFGRVIDDNDVARYTPTFYFDTSILAMLKLLVGVRLTDGKQFHLYFHNGMQATSMTEEQGATLFDISTHRGIIYTGYDTPTMTLVPVSEEFFTFLSLAPRSNDYPLVEQFLQQKKLPVLICKYTATDGC